MAISGFGRGSFFISCEHRSPKTQLDRLNSLGGQRVSTTPVRRDVNPLINSMLILEALEDTDVMKIEVKDFGMFADTHVMGFLGPRVIASATIAVRDEVDGYLELTPIKWLALNGPPVIHIRVRWSKIGEGLMGLPTPGSTSSLADAWQAIRPSAPQAMAMDCQLAILPEQTGATTNTNSVDNQASRDQSYSSGAGCSGVPASSGDPAPQPTMFNNSSSAFHINPDVFDVAKPNDFLRILLRMQEKGGTVYPFHAIAGRDYSCVGASFDTRVGEYATVWGPIPDCHLPEGLEEVHDVMETFAVKGQNNPHWCSGVLVLLAWLKALKEDPSS